MSKFNLLDFNYLLNTSSTLDPFINDADMVVDIDADNMVEGVVAQVAIKAVVVAVVVVVRVTWTNYFYFQE